MKRFAIIWLINFLILSIHPAAGQDAGRTISFNFYGDALSFVFNPSDFVEFDESELSEITIRDFYTAINQKNYTPLLKALHDYREKQKPDDWLYYQLVRKTAQQISPKADNYIRYTLYKWFLMARSGYDPLLSIHKNQLLFYIQCDENVYNIPYRVKNGKPYVCLNYHDYGSNIDFEKQRFQEVNVAIPPGKQTFSYKIHKLPDFDAADYVKKELQFSMNNNEYHFQIKVNPQVKTIFANYPTVDYEDYFNMPLSNDTYASLIPLLKKQVKGMKIKNGVDYLMRFTRYAFVYEPDTKQFGNEKRLTPEQTLLYESSDCEDRVFLFYYLVKEIYNLPMIVMVYPEHHVTIAVKFDKPIGTPVAYNGQLYTVCEPTPQSNSLKMGELSPILKNERYDVVFVYQPGP